MVPKAHFADFSSPDPGGNFFLRPDLLKAAFLLDGTSGLPAERDASLEGLAAEKANDKAVQQVQGRAAGPKKMATQCLCCTLALGGRVPAACKEPTGNSTLTGLDLTGAEAVRAGHALQRRRGAAG